jgi:hypothetical protein
MTNHYHLLVRTPLTNLHKALRHLNSVYTQFFNRSNSIDGALFRGRYKAIIVSEAEYLLLQDLTNTINDWFYSEGFAEFIKHQGVVSVAFIKQEMKKQNSALLFLVCIGSRRKLKVFRLYG